MRRTEQLQGRGSLREVAQPGCVEPSGVGRFGAHLPALGSLQGGRGQEGWMQIYFAV